MRLQQLIRQWVGPGPLRIPVPRPKDLISPGGAILALVCFFLPWGRFSCAGYSRRLSGAQLGGSFWIVFAAAAAIPAIVATGLVLRQHRRARRIVTACSLVGLAVALMRQIEFVRGHETGFGRLHARDVGVQLHLGGAGTVLGLLIALAGSIRIVPRSRRAETPHRTPPP